MKRILLIAAYRLAPALHRLRRWTGLPGRSRTGAAVAVLFSGKLLVVRHSYRRGIGLPGGQVEAGESAQEAAVRELREELDLVVPEAELVPVYNSLTTRIFEYRPASPPPFRVDGIELVDARFVDPGEVTDPDDALASYLLCRIP